MMLATLSVFWKKTYNSLGNWSMYILNNSSEIKIGVYIKKNIYGGIVKRDVGHAQKGENER